MRTEPETKPTIEQEAQEYYNAVFDDELKKLLDQAESGDEQAADAVEAMAHDISKEVTYYVTLVGGGPAARLAVKADEYGGIEDARLEYQDWFTPWTSAPQQDAELVKRLAGLLGYYGG